MPRARTGCYSNVSIALFGYLAARSLGRPFDDLMEQWLIPALGLSHTFIKVPQDQMGNYAYGYSKDNKPTRVTPGVLDSEAYGVKTTAADLIRFVEANMGLIKLDQQLQHAITDTHTGYLKAGALTQVWPGNNTHTRSRPPHFWRGTGRR